jgi:SAM-dependent methyltransferase
MTEKPQTIVFSAGDVASQYAARVEPVIFAPWAEQLVARAGVAPGARVLDLASGTGAAARAAARAAGRGGSVLATDISPAMLAALAEREPEPDAAPIAVAPASADSLPRPDASIDVVLCQQGLQFMPDRAAVVREVRRVLVPGGVFAAAVWDREQPLVPFDAYAGALAGAGVEPPFPGAFDPGRYALHRDELAGLFDGFSEVEAETVELEITWPDLGSAVAGIHGTPFAPLFAGLEPSRREAVAADIARRLGGGGGELRHAMHAVIVRGRA